MSRIEWPVWASGRCALITIDEANIVAKPTRENLNDAAVAKAVKLGHTDAEPFLTLTEPKWQPVGPAEHEGRSGMWLEPCQHASGVWSQVFAPDLEDDDLDWEYDPSIKESRS